MATSHALVFISDGYKPSVAIAAVVLSLTLLYWAVLPGRFDAREPPVLRPTIPIIGHLIGLIRLSHNYHRFLFQKHKMPICTLPILSGKLYVINSPELAQSAIRSRSLSFEPHVTEFIERMTDIGEDAMRIYRDADFFSKWIKIVYSTLTGDNLLAVNSAAVQVVVDSLNGIPAKGKEVPDLFLWTRDLLTMAGTTSLLGSKNPWKKDAKLCEAYWDFERDLVKMMLNIMPSSVAPKAYYGREALQNALTEYFASDHGADDDIPKFTEERMALERSFGMTPSAMAGLEIAVIHGSLSNTIPTAFWMLVYVFSNPELVERLRAEAKSVVTETRLSDRGQRVMTINIVRLEDRCPLLFSTFRETQRVISIAVLNRRILADTVVSDGKKSYLLKKGNALQISHGVTHNLEEVWGPTVREFDPKRFIRLSDVSSGDNDSGTPIPPGAYTPFGAGKHICPGRFFASGEILGFILPLILGFEVVGSTGGPVHIPDVATPWITTGLGKPRAGSDLAAVIRKRAEWEDVLWQVVAPKSGS